MQKVCRQFALLRPAVSTASGVALVLAFLLATHVFWCALASPACEADFAGDAPTGIAATQSIAPHTHVDADICAGMDEAKSRVSAAVSPFITPVLLWIALVFTVAAQLPLLLAQRAAVFGRDGPVNVPSLHRHLLRASLPHRAPPVALF